MRRSILGCLPFLTNCKAMGSRINSSYKQKTTTTTTKLQYDNTYMDILVRAARMFLLCQEEAKEVFIHSYVRLLKQQQSLNLEFQFLPQRYIVRFTNDTT